MSPRRSHGLALAIVLILLLGLGLLAIAGMGGAAASLALAGMAEQRASAFEAAEGAVARALRDWPDLQQAAPALPGDAATSARLYVQHDSPDEAGAAAPGFSIGDGADAFRLRHVTLTAEAAALRGAAARVEQTFVVVGAAE